MERRGEIYFAEYPAAFSWAGFISMYGLDAYERCGRICPFIVLETAAF